MAILFESAVRTTCIAAAFGLLIALLRLRSPAVRHAIWASLVLTMLVLPLATIGRLRVPVRILSPRHMPVHVVATAPVPIQVGRATIEIPQLPPAPPAEPSASWVDVFVVVYVGGFAVLGFQLLMGAWQAHVLIRRATPISGPLTSAGVVTPMTTGVWRPRVILPSGWTTWPAVERAAILAHESEHVRRRDPLVQWFALLNRALFWFHPLAWWLPGQLARLAEEACDAAVLTRGTDPQAYAEALLRCAQAAAAAGARLQYTVGMAMPGSGVARRIERVLGGWVDQRPSRQRVIVAALAGALVVSLFAVAMPAQAPPANPIFEVASVKPNNSGSGGMLVYPQSGGLLTLENNPLNMVIGYPYNVPTDQIVGPDWIRTMRFDIVARTGSPATPVLVGPASVSPMLRSLLQERFTLAAHLESRPVPKYALVVARSDGRLGPQLHPSTTDCGPILAKREVERAGALKVAEVGSPCSGTPQPGHFVADSMPLAALAKFLAGFHLVDRDIVDRTGLTGLFTLTLDLDPAVSIYTALQEQLGLKLEATTVPSDVVAIDHIEPLIPN